MNSMIVTYKGAVASWETDHLGHFNVRFYVAKFDEATWNMASEIGLTRQFIEDQRQALVALEQNLRYLRELRAGDALLVRTRVLEIGRKTVRFFHEMENTVTGEIAATCEILAIYFDLDARSALDLPPALRAAAEKLVLADPLELADVVNQAEA